MSWAADIAVIQTRVKYQTTVTKSREVDALELIKSYSFSSTKSPVKTWKDEVKGLAQYLNILTRTEYVTHSQLLKCSGKKKKTENGQKHGLTCHL